MCAVTNKDRAPRWLSSDPRGLAWEGSCNRCLGIFGGRAAQLTAVNPEETARSGVGDVPGTTLAASARTGVSRMAKIKTRGKRRCDLLQPQPVRWLWPVALAAHPVINCHRQSLENDMHIGLIGGIGVAASVVYYQRLAAAMELKKARLRLTLSHGDIHTLIANNLADRRQPQADIFARQIDALKAAGAELAALTSLGAHFCFDELAAISSLPLVSGVAPLDAYFRSRGLRRIGLLGTRVVMRTRLYGQLAWTEAVALDDDIETLGQTYQEVAVAGACTPEQRQLFLEAGRKMVAEQGAEAIVLAGTDLNLAFDGQHPGYQVIDALNVHVALLAQLAAGEIDIAEACARG